MRTSARSVASLFVLLALSAAACTGDDEPQQTPTASAGASTGVVTNSERVTYVPGEFEYRFNDVAATFSMEDGRLTVRNASGAELGDPALYVIGIDDKRYEGTVETPAPVPDGAESSFEVTFPDTVTADSIGLIVLLFGGSNYGAMAPVPAA